MLTFPTTLSRRLLKQAQSTRLSVPKRLRALSELAQGIDQALTLVTPQIALEPTKSNVPTLTADVATVLDEAAHLVHAQLLPRMRRYRVQIVAVEQLSETQRTWLWHYFQQQIYPLLTPLAIDSGHPFPYLQSKRLNFLVALRPQASQGLTKPRYGVVQIPARLPRLIQAPPYPSSAASANRVRPLRCLVWREEIVRYFLPSLFSGLTVDAAYQFRLLRVQNDSNSAGAVFGPSMTEQRTGLTHAPVMRLDIEKRTPPPLRRWLINQLRVNDDAVLDCATPLDLADLCQLADYLAPH